jgi:hypothetical protein
MGSANGVAYMKARLLLVLVVGQTISCSEVNCHGVDSWYLSSNM